MKVVQRSLGMHVSTLRTNERCDTGTKGLESDPELLLGGHARSLLE